MSVKFGDIASDLFGSYSLLKGRHGRKFQLAHKVAFISFDFGPVKPAAVFSGTVFFFCAICPFVKAMRLARISRINAAASSAVRVFIALSVFIHRYALTEIKNNADIAYNHIFVVSITGVSGGNFV